MLRSTPASDANVTSSSIIVLSLMGCVDEEAEAAKEEVGGEEAEAD